MGPPANAPPAPEAAVWPSTGGSLPQPGDVLSRSGSGSLSEAEAARQQAKAGQQAAAKRPTAKPPLTSEEARQQARAEGLTLLVTNSKYNSKTGYFGVSQKGPERAKPFHAQVTRDGRTTTLGSFSTAEEAALCIARSPEGQQEVAKRRLAPLTSEKVLRQQAREAAEFREIRVQSCEEEARHVAAKVQSCRAAEDDVLAMLAMAMEATPTVSDEVRHGQQAEAQYDTEGDEAEDMLAVLMEAYYDNL